MTYHLRLKNAMSYTGVVNATREEPDVFTADEAIKAAALRSGYFDLVDVLAEQDTAAPADADTIPLTPAGEQADDGSTPATLRVKRDRYTHTTRERTYDPPQKESHSSGGSSVDSDGFGGSSGGSF